jgi:hypothetical protein
MKDSRLAAAHEAILRLEGFVTETEIDALEARARLGDHSLHYVGPVKGCPQCFDSLLISDKEKVALIAELNVKLEACRSARAILAKRVSESYEGGGREAWG